MYTDWTAVILLLLTAAPLAAEADVALTIRKNSPSPAIARRWPWPRQSRQVR
jgi:hypothetical protein